MPAITLPTTGGDNNAWGPILNTAITTINNAVDGVITSDALKAADNVVVKLTGNQSISGVKTFTSAPAVPADSFAIDRIVGLVSALAGKQATGDYTLNSSLRLPIPMTQAAFNAITPVSGQVYVITA